jgi:hypothetical protein
MKDTARSSGFFYVKTQLGWFVMSNHFSEPVFEAEGEYVPHPLFLDIPTLRTLTGYAHWIPGIRGLYKNYFAKNFPGWAWNQIIPVLIQRKVLVMHPTDQGYRQLSHGLYISSQIQGIWISISVKDGNTKINSQKVKVQKGVSQNDS